MKKLLILLMAAAFAPSAAPAAAQSPETYRQLEAARDTIWRAFFANDTALLRRFLPPSATSVEGADLRWSDRKQIASDSREFKRSNGRLIDLKFDNTDVVITGHSALVRSNFQAVVAQGGRTDTSRGYATELFVLMNGTWVNPYWQLQPMNGRSIRDAAREIPLPDTLGASFAIGDSVLAKGTVNDYDALTGSWEFKFQSRRADGTYWMPFRGHWTFDKKPGGGLVEDRWRPDDSSQPMGFSLYTYRSFDAERKVWQIIGTESEGGVIQPGLTWVDGKDLLVIQRNGNNLSRIRYLQITPDHFLWRSDASRDGGRTWMLDSGMMEAWRIGK